ncbi:MAG: F0F1 ATP synthase subunit delta [Pirellulaceae bacterium]
MLIDWFTVVAQTFNFLILVWLLKRFLYGPILDAIDSREKRIAKELADADAKMTEARQERDEFHRKNEEFAQQGEARLSQLKDEVNATRQRLLDDARQAADALTATRHEVLQREQQSFSNEIRRRAQEEVFSITRKTLRDLADTSLEECITNVFTRRVRELNGEAKQGLAKALTASADPARVRSAFELSTAQRFAIRQTLNETFSADIQLRFETAPDVIGGIELTANGRQIAWSIADYLRSLEKSIGEVIQEQAHPATPPDMKTESVP